MDFSVISDNLSYPAARRLPGRPARRSGADPAAGVALRTGFGGARPGPRRGPRGAARQAAPAAGGAARLLPRDPGADADLLDLLPAADRLPCRRTGAGHRGLRAVADRRRLPRPLGVRRHPQPPRRAVGGRPRARTAAVAGIAPGDPAAGAAGDAAILPQPVGVADQGHFPGLRDRRRRAVLRRHPGEQPGDGPPDGDLPVRRPALLPALHQPRPGRRFPRPPPAAWSGGRWLEASPRARA